MTKVLFSINHAGQVMSSTFYTITAETLNRKIITDELIDEVLRRCSSAQGIPAWRFTFDDLQVEILKKYDHKIEFFVSRGILPVIKYIVIDFLKTTKKGGDYENKHD